MDSDGNLDGNQQRLGISLWIFNSGISLRLHDCCWRCTNVFADSEELCISCNPVINDSFSIQVATCKLMIRCIGYAANLWTVTRGIERRRESTSAVYQAVKLTWSGLARVLVLSSGDSCSARLHALTGSPLLRIWVNTILNLRLYNASLNYDYDGTMDGRYDNKR